MARRSAVKAQPNALVAAATRIRIGDKRLAARQASRPQDWQQEAWGFYNANQPELKHGVWFTGNAMSKLRLFAGVRPKDAPQDSEPIPVDDEDSDLPPELAAAALAELDRLRSTRGGLPEIQRRLNMNLEVAAECWLVGIGAREHIRPDGSREITPEQWSIRSISEIQIRDGSYFLKAGPNDQQGMLLDLTDDTHVGTDTCIRIWQPHPEWESQADNHMSGLLGELRILQVLTNQVAAEAMSGLPAEILTVPNELSFGPADPSHGEGGDEALVDPFEEELDAQIAEAIEDPTGSMAAVRPLLVRGPAEYMTPDYMRTISLARGGDGKLEERIELHCQRFARGWNLPVEVVMGHQATTFANAEQVDQDTYEDYLQARATQEVDSLTTGYLQPNMLDAYPQAAEDIARICVWFDPSALIAQPNTEVNAPVAHGLNIISDSATRRALGFSDDDAPDAVELIIRAGLRRGILTAELTAALLQELADEAGVALPSPEELAPGGAPPPAETQMQTLAQMLVLQQQRRNGHHPDAVEASARPAVDALPARWGGDWEVLPHALRAAANNDLGRQLTDLDRDLRTRLVVLADATMARALDRAGARLRSRAGPTREVLRTVSNHLAASTLGRTLVAQAGFTEAELLEDTLTAMEGQFMAWGATAQTEAIELAGTAVAGFTVAQREVLMLRQVADLAEAWTWLKSALIGLGSQLLYDPNPLTPDFGEVDASMSVPTGLIRQALARAGGAGGLITQNSDAWVALTDSGTRPAGGIGTGEVIREMLRQGGASVEAFQWVYGPARRSRPFIPHQQLDGTVFRNFDDPALANTSGFPEFAFYMPGDHAGCVCDFTPIIIPADQAGALEE